MAIWHFGANCLMHMHFSLTLCEIRTTQCSVVPKSKYVRKVISSVDIHVMEWYIKAHGALKLMHSYQFLTNMPLHTGVSGSIYLFILDWLSQCPELEVWSHSWEVLLFSDTFQCDFCTPATPNFLYFWPLWMSDEHLSMHALMCICGGKLNRLCYGTP